MVCQTLKARSSLTIVSTLQQNIVFVTLQRLSLKLAFVQLLLPICPGERGIHACTASACALWPCLQVCDANYLWCLIFVGNKSSWVAWPMKTKHNEYLTYEILSAKISPYTVIPSYTQYQTKNVWSLIVMLLKMTAKTSTLTVELISASIVYIDTNRNHPYNKHCMPARWWQFNFFKYLV